VSETPNPAHIEWVMVRYRALVEREHDPVEDAEREAHFETAKNKDAKK
jgi:hypothetical protein